MTTVTFASFRQMRDDKLPRVTFKQMMLLSVYNTVKLKFTYPMSEDLVLESCYESPYTSGI